MTDFDPTNCCNMIVALAARIQRHPELKEEVVLLANLVTAMHTWLSDGGELPEQWK